MASHQQKQTTEHQEQISDLIFDALKEGLGHHEPPAEKEEDPEHPDKWVAGNAKGMHSVETTQLQPGRPPVVGHVEGITKGQHKFSKGREEQQQQQQESTAPSQAEE